VEAKVRGQGGLLLLAACILGLASGCSRGRQYPPTHSVSGVVTFEGQPVADALVSFLPVDGQNPANGSTDASGRYELTSFTRGDGAMEGSFRVTIVKYEKEAEDKPAVSAEKPAAEAESEETGNEGYVPAGMVVSQYDEGPKNLLPKQYADQQKTPLTAAVRADQNVIDFDLSK
jgi:hypothetical protein